MTVASLIWNERSTAWEQMRPIIHIRVTQDAFRGAPTTAPVSPERARTLGKLWAFSDGTVDARYDGRDLELLIHPADWFDLLKDMEAARQHVVQFAMRPGEPDRVFDIPVSQTP